MGIVIATPPGSQHILRTRAIAQDTGPWEATILCPTSRRKSLWDPGLPAAFLWWPHVYWRIITVCFSDRHCSATHPKKHLLFGGNDLYLPVGSGKAANPSTSSLLGWAPSTRAMTVSCGLSCDCVCDWASRMFPATFHGCRRYRTEGKNKMRPVDKQK